MVEAGAKAPAARKGRARKAAATGPEGVRVAWKKVRLTGWGRVPAAECLAARPERLSEALAAMRAADDPVLAFGAGRSYGDAALNGGGRVVLTERLNRILAFDPESGEVVVEPGVTFRDLIDVFLPRGFMPPTTPGTAFATIGGAVANDVHGKNHHVAGSFGAHVRWLDLLLPGGKVVRASPTERPEIFRATVGGIGLTGLILAVCFGLTPAPSNAVEVRQTRIANLDDFLAAFAANGSSTYSVGWIDALARGRALGRGILELAEPSPVGVPARPRRDLTVPFDFPAFALNNWSVRAFNEIYWRKVPEGGAGGRVACDRFLYPLDAVLRWNRVYGKGGFRQFQCVVPPAEGPAALRKLLEEIGRAGGASFLAVLKAMGDAAPVGHLSFGMAGYTLALDFPERPGTVDLLRRLERITRDHGGRIYLAKDSCLSPEGFREMYPGLPAFEEALAGADPGHRMRSDMAVRLGIRGGGR